MLTGSIITLIGIGIMTLSLVIGVVCLIVYFSTGKGIRKKLEKEYGVLKR